MAANKTRLKSWSQEHSREFCHIHSILCFTSVISAVYWSSSGGKAEAPILHKVSLKYILNKGALDCTSFRKLQPRVLAVLLQASLWERQLLIQLVTELPGTKAIRLSMLLLLPVFLITYKLCSLVHARLVTSWLPAVPHHCEKVGTAKHALLLTSAFLSEALILPFEQNNARHDLSSHVFFHERRQGCFSYSDLFKYKPIIIRW